MKKFCFLGLLALLILFIPISISAGGLLSPAISVLQEEVQIIKTGVGTNTVSFDPADFSEALGTEHFLGVEIKSLPDEADGTLKLGSLDVEVGQFISCDAIAALRFIPAEAGKTASFTFRPYGDQYENPFVCTVCMLESLNGKPSAKAGSIEAKESVPVFASLTAEDPDGDTLTYFIVDSPKKGNLTLLDAQKGEYRYTAGAGSAGEDSFTFVAVDCYGNRSDPATVSIKTSENKSGILYTDMKGNDAHLSAVALAEKDVFIGEKIGGEAFFYPEKAVSRADFLIMAMQLCDVEVNLLAPRRSSFADAADFSAYQMKYITTAESLGLIVGLDSENGRIFDPNTPITSSQASTILARIATGRELSFSDAVAACVDADAEISDDGYAMLASVGLVATEDRTAAITRADAAKLLYNFSKCR